MIKPSTLNDSLPPGSAGAAFKLLVDNLPDTACVIDLDSGKVIYLNRPDLLGHSLEALHDADTLARILRPDDLAAFLGLLQSTRTAQPGQTLFEVFPVLNGDDQRRLIHLRARVLGHGDAHWALYTITDITGQEAMRTQVRFLERIVDQSPNSVLMTDLSGVIQYINPAGCRQTGYSREELIGQRPNMLQSGLTPGEKYRELWAELNHGRTWQGEFINRRKNGSLYWTQAMISPVVDDDQTVLGYVSVEVDMSERKRVEDALRESEARYRMLAEHASDVIWTMDFDGNVTYISPAIERLLGVTPEEALAQTFEEALPAHSYKRLNQSLQRIIDVAFGNEDPDTVLNTRFELEQRHRDGHSVWTEIESTIVRDELGNPQAILGITRDISERHQAEAKLHAHQEQLEEMVRQRTQELQKANERLQKLSDLKDQFVSNISHELRTPLANFKLFLQLLPHRPDKQEHYLETLRRETARLESIIEEMIAISDIDSGHRQRTAVDLNEIVRVYVNDRMAFAENKQIDLALDAVGEPLILEADPHLLERVVGVLVMNALQYTPSGGAVTVETLGIEGEVGFRVRDTGPGIPGEELPYLFDRFYRGAIGTQMGVSGSGLGLAMARRIVQQMDGVIEVDPGGNEIGATFTVRLPGLN